MKAVSVLLRIAGFAIILGTGRLADHFGLSSWQTLAVLLSAGLGVFTYERGRDMKRGR